MDINELIKKRLPSEIVYHLTPENRRNYLEYNRDAIVHLYKNGWSLFKVSDFFGVRPKLMLRMLRSWAVPIRKETFKPKIKVTREWLIKRGVMSSKATKMMSYTQRRMYLEHHKDYIIYLYVTKQSPVELVAKSMGVSQRTIRERLKEWGIKLRNKTPRVETAIIEANKQNIINWYTRKENPLTAMQIGQKLGIAEPTIQLRLKEWGIMARSYKKAVPELVENLWRKGFDVNQIAEKLKCDHTCVRRALDISMSRSNFDDVQRKRLKYLYSERGMSVAHITQALNEFVMKRSDLSKVDKRRRLITDAATYGEIRRLGLKKGSISPENVSMQDLSNILGYLKQGRRLNEIAKLMLMGRSDVFQVIQKYKFIKIRRAYQADDELVKRVRQLAEEGHSAQLIAAQLGISIQVLYNIMEKNGIKTKAKVTKYTQEQLDVYANKIRELRKHTGMTQDKISHQLGLSKATVNRIISDYNIPAPARVFTDEEKALVRSLHKQGLTINEIGARIGRRRKQVEYLLWKQGITPNPAEKSTPYSEAALALQNEYIKRYYQAPYLFSMKTLSEKLGIDKTTVKIRIEKLGIPVRTADEAKAVRHRRTMGGLPGDFIIPDEHKKKMSERQMLVSPQARGYLTFKVGEK